MLLVFSGHLHAIRNVYPKSPAQNCPHLPPTQGSTGIGEVSNSTSWRAVSATADTPKAGTKI